MFYFISVDFISSNVIFYDFSQHNNPDPVLLLTEKNIGHSMMIVCFLTASPLFFSGRKHVKCPLDGVKTTARGLYEVLKATHRVYVTLVY